MAVSLNEDNLGFSATEVFIPNIVVCAAVAIKLTDGFAGIHFTPATQEAEINVAVEFAAETLAPLGGSVQELVFFVKEEDFGTANKKLVTDALHKAFNKTATIIKKSTAAHGAIVDLWLHAPAETGNTSWIGVRPHPNQTPQQVTTPSPHVYKINTLTKPPSIAVARFQNLPGDAKTKEYKGTYTSL